MTVEKFSNGVYRIINETFIVQIIVTKELLPEENLYLHCLTDDLNNANSNTKGESPMFEEMMERTRIEAENYCHDKIE